MERKKRITTYNGKVYDVSMEEAAGIVAAEKRGEKRVILRDDTWLSVANIADAEDVTVSHYEPAAMDLRLPDPTDFDLGDIKPRTEHQARWYKLLHLNMAALKQKKRQNDNVPLLKDLADLDHYEQTGEWPDYAPVATWRTHFPVKRCAYWVKRHVTQREYNSSFAASPVYYKLSNEGSDVVVAQLCTKPPSERPEDLEACTEAESKRLDYLRSRRKVVAEQLPVVPGQPQQQS